MTLKVQERESVERLAERLGFEQWQYTTDERTGNTVLVFSDEAGEDTLRSAARNLLEFIDREQMDR